MVLRVLKCSICHQKPIHNLCIEAAHQAFRSWSSSSHGHGHGLVLDAKAPCELREPKAWLWTSVGQSGHLKIGNLNHLEHTRQPFFHNFFPTSSTTSSSSTVLIVRFKKSTTAASYFAGCFRKCWTCADPVNLRKGFFYLSRAWQYTIHHYLVAENLAPSLLRFSSTSLSRYFCGR